MNFEQKESEPQLHNQDAPQYDLPDAIEDRPYAEHPVVARGEEDQIILGEN